MSKPATATMGHKNRTESITATMRFNRCLLETEQRAIMIVDEVTATAQVACDTGFRMALSFEANKPLNSSPEEENPHSELTDLLESYFQQACRDAAAHFRAMLYKVLYKNWKESLPQHVEPASLMDWVIDLPIEIRDATRAKVQRIMSSLVSIQRVHKDAHDQVHPTLQKFQALAHAYVERKADHVLEPYLDDAEKMNELKRMEDDARAYITRQLLTHLKADKEGANQRLYQAMADLFRDSIKLDGYAQSLQKWADATVETMQSL